ncbi:hypothetical protein BDZ94DRAFT_1268952 [Collybia nuda]|uniref:Transmembrane protein n=1 Tax=Collybia nuda TaxID=64659 RepID=A0A9P5Y0V0_9AGAR|nr:hypothetical protein BDZ94DRAFT_1268952 [Collybia nuda]
MPSWGLTRRGKCSPSAPTMSGLLPPVLEEKQASPVQSTTNVSTIGHGHGDSEPGGPVPAISIEHLPEGPLRSARRDSRSASYSSSNVVVVPRDLSLSKPVTSIAKQQQILEKLPPPSHWKAPHPSEPLGRVQQIIFNLLCLTSFGDSSLDSVWAAMCLEEAGDESLWVEGTRRMYGRLSNLLVVAGLLLVSSAVFVTTVPPRAAMINYTLRGPYICILGSFALLLGGIIVGSALLLVVGKAQPCWSKEVLCANRFHVYCTLIMLSYPFFSTAMGTLLLTFGLLSAVWCAEDRAIQGACVIVLVLPVSMAVLFGVSCATASAGSRLRKAYGALGGQSAS